MAAALVNDGAIRSGAFRLEKLIDVGLTTDRVCRVNSFGLIARALQLHGQ